MARVDPKWQRFGPSAVAAGPGWTTPRPMDMNLIDQVVQDFCAATRRAEQAGFDALELHFGHGYLVASFLSPKSNRRDDDYGGDRDGRMKLALRIAAEVRAVWPASKPLFCRISAVDGSIDGWNLDDSVVLARKLKSVGVDVVDCSSGGLTEETRALPVPRGLGFQVPFSHRIRAETGVLTQAVGMIVEAPQAEQILQAGQADLIALGREALFDPYWALHAREELAPDPHFEDWPLRHGIWLDKRLPALRRALIERDGALP
jgi:2,4-dienoyl-CoA reductase-like NADH-dependent reductase (Old Yellow Enzyme family)